MIVTLVAKRVRNVASSMAESPPPITTISFPEKKKPSQVAQEETPWPISFCSLGRPSQRAECAARDNQRLSVYLVHAKVEQEGTLAEVDAGEMRHAVFRAEALRLLAHVLDQLRSHDSFREAGKIFHQRGERKLAAGFVALDDKRFQIGAGGVKRGSVSGAAGTDDHDIASFAHDLD